MEQPGSQHPAASAERICDSEPPPAPAEQPRRGKVRWDGECWAQQIQQPQAEGSAPGTAQESPELGLPGACSSPHYKIDVMEPSV